MVLRMLPRLLLCSFLLAAPRLHAQPVARIYVAEVARDSGLSSARKDLLTELRKLKSVQIVASPDQANATLLTTGEIYVKGFYSLNPRSGLSPEHGHPIYGGYLSVQVKGTSGDTLWSYFADTSQSKDAARELSRKIVKHFAETFVGKT